MQKIKTELVLNSTTFTLSGFLIELAEIAKHPKHLNEHLRTRLMGLYSAYTEADENERINQTPLYAPNWRAIIKSEGWDFPISREDAIHYLHGYDPAISVTMDEHQDSSRKRRAPPPGIEKRYWAMYTNIFDWNKKYPLSVFPYSGWTSRTLYNWAIAHDWPLPKGYPKPPETAIIANSSHANTTENKTEGPASENILRIKDVCKKVKLSNSRIYKLMSTSEFPASINLGGRTRGWREVEVDNWVRKQANQPRPLDPKVKRSIVEKKNTRNK